MARPVFNLFLVVLLLTVEWVYDPHDGTSPLSSRFSSQPCLQPNLAPRVAQARLDRGWFSPFTATLIPILVVEQASMRQLLPEPAAAGGSGLIYLLMTILR